MGIDQGLGWALGSSSSLHSFGEGVGVGVQTGQWDSHSALPTSEECERFLQQTFLDRFSGEVNFEAKEVNVLLGLGPAGKAQVKEMQAHEELKVVSRLNGFVKDGATGFCWTALQVFHNVLEELLNASMIPSTGEVWLVTLGRFRGGGLWIEGDQGVGPVVRLGSDGMMMAGHVIDTRARPVRFDGTRRHKIEPWEGNLWLIRAFVPCSSGLNVADYRSWLENRGFYISELLLNSQSVRECTTSQAEGSVATSDGDRAGKVQGARLESKGEVKTVAPRDEEWEVAHPHQVVDEEWLEGATMLHEATSALCKLLSQELGGASLDSESFSSCAAELRSALKERNWWEGLLAVGSVWAVLGSCPLSAVIGDRGHAT